MPKFIHADNCTLYAEDAQETDEPWLRWQERLCETARWIDCDGPIAFHQLKDYRRKPRTVRIGEFDVPEPVREQLMYDQEYWIADVSKGKPHRNWWTGSEYALYWLAAGLIHMTEEAAQIHIDAMVSFTRRGEK